MKIFRSLPVVSGLLFASMALTAQAATLGFENVAPPGGEKQSLSIYSESGYTLTSNIALAVSSTSFNAPGYAPARATDFYTFCACGWGGSTSIARTDGKLFSLQGFDAASGPGSLDLRLVGIKADDSQVEYNLALMNGQWSTFNFLPALGFTNLKSVTIYGIGGALAGSLDDIVVSEVPVPAAAWLFGSALAGLGMRVGRRTSSRS
jgi:hypothetical protein